MSHKNASPAEGVKKCLIRVISLTHKRTQAYGGGWLFLGSWWRRLFSLGRAVEAVDFLVQSTSITQVMTLCIASPQLFSHSPPLYTFSVLTKIWVLSNCKRKSASVRRSYYSNHSVLISKKSYTVFKFRVGYIAIQEFLTATSVMKLSRMFFSDSEFKSAQKGLVFSLAHHHRVTRRNLWVCLFLSYHMLVSMSRSWLYYTFPYRKEQTFYPTLVW